MSDWSNILLDAALVLYSLGALVSISVIITRRRERAFLIPWLTLAGFVVHLGGIIARGVAERGVPVENLRGIMFLVAWAAISVYLFAHFRFRLEVMGVVILPLVVALMLVTLMLPQGSEPGAAPHQATGIETAGRLIHIVPAILGVSALFLTFASSIIYLIQERALKSHRPLKMILRLPSLERCEKLGYQSLTWGFSLLSFVVLTGVVSAGYRPDANWGWLLREKWSLLAWLIFAVIIYDRIFSGGWRGRKAAYLSIIGFGVMILRMVGV